MRVRETERYERQGERGGARPWRRGRGDEGVVCALSAGNQSRISDAQPVAICETRSIGSRISLAVSSSASTSPFRDLRVGDGASRACTRRGCTNVRQFSAGPRESGDERGGRRRKGVG